MTAFVEWDQTLPLGTRLRDYENAIHENTRVLLRVHPSNFKITGFAEKPSLEELAATAEKMSGQAEHLKKLMGFFKFEGNIMAA